MSCSLHIHLPPWPVLRGSHPYPLRKHCPPDWKDMLRVSATGGRGFVQLTPLTPLTSLVSQGSVWNSCLDKERMCPAVTEWGRSQATTWPPSPSKGLTALPRCPFLWLAYPGPGVWASMFLWLTSVQSHQHEMLTRHLAKIQKFPSPLDPGETLWHSTSSRKKYNPRLSFRKRWF